MSDNGEPRSINVQNRALRKFFELRKHLTIDESNTEEIKIDSDEELWILKCPKNTDPEDLLGRKLDLTEPVQVIQSKHKNKTFDCTMELEKPQKYLTLICPTNGFPEAVSVKQAGTITIQEQSTLPQLNGSISSTTDSTSKEIFSLPTNLKIRHPLHGLHSDDIEIKEEEETDDSYVSSPKKEGKRKKSRAPDSSNTIQRFIKQEPDEKSTVPSSKREENSKKKREDNSDIIQRSTKQEPDEETPVSSSPSKQEKKSKKKREDNSDVIQHFIKQEPKEESSSPPNREKKSKKRPRVDSSDIIEHSIKQEPGEESSSKQDKKSKKAKLSTSDITPHHIKQERESLLSPKREKKSKKKAKWDNSEQDSGKELSSSSSSLSSSERKKKNKKKPKRDTIKKDPDEETLSSDASSTKKLYTPEVVKRMFQRRRAQELHIKPIKIKRES